MGEGVWFDRLTSKWKRWGGMVDMHKLCHIASNVYEIIQNICHKMLWETELYGSIASWKATGNSEQKSSHNAKLLNRKYEAKWLIFYWLTLKLEFPQGWVGLGLRQNNIILKGEMVIFWNKTFQYLSYNLLLCSWVCSNSHGIPGLY